MKKQDSNVKEKKSSAFLQKLWYTVSMLRREAAGNPAFRASRSPRRGFPCVISSARIEYRIPIPLVVGSNPSRRATKEVLQQLF